MFITSMCSLMKQTSLDSRTHVKETFGMKAKIFLNANVERKKNV